MTKKPHNGSYERTPDTERRRIASSDQTRAKNRVQPSMPKLPWKDASNDVLKEYDETFRALAKDEASDRKDKSDD